MATAYRVGPGQALAVQLEHTAFDPAVHRLAVRVAGQLYRLDVDGVGAEGWVRLASTGFSVERLVIAFRDAPLEVVLTDAGHRQVLGGERLGFHQSFFAPLVDFTAMALPGYEATPYPRPGRLAAFTHVYEDVAMLRLWVRHYGALGEDVDLYVIDHGSSTPVAAAVPDRVQVVRIPRGTVDHANIAQFCNHFQRFLLTQYRWVIHVDVDELLVPEDGSAAWRQRLDADAGPPRIVEPAHGVDLVQHPDLEGPLDLDQPVSLQRRFLVPEPAFCKPALVSRPATWGPGFHYAVESFAVATDPLLWLVHLVDVDAALRVARNRKWRATPPSAGDVAQVDHSHRQVDLEAVKADCRRRVLSDGVLPLPDWMRGRF